MSKYDEESAELCEALDALDAAHAEEVREAREDGYQEGLRDARANLVADRREGWVELPVDADGVRWTGEEREFADSDGRRGGCVGLLWLGDEWAVMDSLPHDFVTDAPGMCRHVPDADTPASLADELEDAMRGNLPDAPTDGEARLVGLLMGTLERLREMGGRP